MGNLFFSLQDDKKMARKFDLLKFIVHRSSASFAEISEELAVSINTVKKDIKDLETEFKDLDIHFSFSDDGKIRLNYPLNFSVDSLVSIYAKTTVAHQIIHALFSRKTITLTNAMIEFNVSKTTYFKIIRRMNASLKKYKLVVKTSPLSFLGREENIRAFLFAFYSDFNDVSLLDDEVIIATKELLRTIENFTKENLHFDFFRLSLYLTILKKRWSYKCFVHTPNELIQKAENQESFFIFHRAFASLYEKLFAGQLPYDEAVHGFFSVLNCIIYSDQYRTKNGEFNYHCSEEPDMLIHAYQFVEKLLNKKHCIAEETEKLVGFLINMRLLSKITSSFEIVGDSTKAMIIKEHFALYSTWHSQLLESSLFPNFSFVYLEDIAVSLTMIHVAIIEKLKAQTEKGVVLLSFQGGNGLNHYLTSTAEKYLPLTIETTDLCTHLINEQNIQKTSPILLVTNYDLSNNFFVSIPHIRLSNIPTATDWQNMLTAIHDILA